MPRFDEVVPRFDSVRALLSERPHELVISLFFNQRDLMYLVPFKRDENLIDDVRVPTF
jgi:hypothetical protein